MQIAREGQAAVLERPAGRAEERAWNREPQGIGCREAVKGATWTQLSLSLRWKASNGQVGLMRERYAF